MGLYFDLGMKKRKQIKTKSVKHTLHSKLLEIRL